MGSIVVVVVVFLHPLLVYSNLYVDFAQQAVSPKTCYYKFVLVNTHTHTHDFH